MSFLIADIKTHVINVPLSTPWEISLYKAETRDHAIVELTTDNGIKGYGEASPSALFMGETASTIKFINDTYFTPLLIGKDIRNIGKIHSELNGTILGHFSAKATIDIAVHDAFAKVMDQPLYNILGGLINEKIALTYVIGMSSDNQIIDEVNKANKLSHRVIKIKVGSNWEQEASLINNVCEFILNNGFKTKVRIDANQGFTVNQAIRFANNLKYIHMIDAFEQPVNKRNVSGLVEVRRQTNLPIMADESIFSLEDAADVFNQKAVSLVNIKLGKVGGIYPAKKIAAVAEAHGIQCTVGSNLELGIGIAANMHFVASTINASIDHDLFAGYGLHEYDIVDQPLINQIKKGILYVPNEIGLGVNFKTAAKI